MLSNVLHDRNLVNSGWKMKVFHFDSYKSNSVIQTVHSSYCESLEDFNRKFNRVKNSDMVTKTPVLAGQQRGKHISHTVGV